MVEILPTIDAVQYEDTERVARLQKGGRLRIVRKAHKVETCLFDAHGITHLCIVGDGIAYVWVALMAIYTTQKGFFTIDKQLVIFDLDRANTNFATLLVYNFTAHLDRCLQGVERR